MTYSRSPTHFCNNCGEPLWKDWPYALCKDCGKKPCHHGTKGDCNKCHEESDFNYDARK